MDVGNKATWPAWKHSPEAVGAIARKYGQALSSHHLLEHRFKHPPPFSKEEYEWCNNYWKARRQADEEYVNKINAERARAKDARNPSRPVQQPELPRPTLTEEQRRSPGSAAIAPAPAPTCEPVTWLDQQSTSSEPVTGNTAV